MTETSVLDRIGRQTISVGSSDACDIQLTGPNIPAVAAEIIHQGDGRLSFLPKAGAQWRAGETLLRTGVVVPFEFSVAYHVGDAVVPNAHPHLCLMLMSPGFMKPTGAQLIVGRDPQRCHLVLTSPGVSGRHATLRLEDTSAITDHDSTSGSWLDGRRLAPGEEQELGEDDIVALGPVPLPISLARRVHAALKSRPAQRMIEKTAAMAQRTQDRSALPSRVPQKPPTRHRTIVGTIRMEHAAVYTVGRTADNDIVLDYAQVSGHHAKITILGAEVFIEDAGSELGTAVRGSRLKAGQKARVSDTERVLFGPMPALLSLKGDQVDLVVEDHVGWAGRPLFDVAAAGIRVVVPDRDRPRQNKVLVDGVHFRALPGDLVALMGPSGSGKTTLLHALTGYLRPAEGEVLVNGRPLPDVFDALRGSIGYVPQDDIIHPELTVYEAVRYSARFRLPHDYTEEEIDQRVMATLSQLGLESVANLQIGKPEQKIISGGQRKRVNIAMELVTDPVLLFLDEPTSGLAADDTTSLIDLLSRLTSEQGKTIIATIHQPARDEYEKFNLTLVLGHGGIPLYFGPSTEAYAFFEAWRGPLEARGINNPRDMFAELKEREARVGREMPGASRSQVRVAVSNAYRDEYEESEAKRAMIQADRSAAGQSTSSTSLAPRSRPRGQLGFLLSRTFRIKARDRIGTAILLLQAPLIGLLLSIVFGAQSPAVPAWCLGALRQLAGQHSETLDLSGKLAELASVQDHAPALFFLVVAAVWFGTSNAAREVVGERAIFRREKMVNLGVTNYVLSKFLVLSVLSALQCLTLLTIVFSAVGLGGGVSAFAMQFAMMTLTAWCSVALGLGVSTLVSSTEAAMALTPIALIPQVVLGGIMVPVTTNPWLLWPMRLMPSRWGFEGVVRPERLAVAQEPGFVLKVSGVTDSPPDFIRNGAFECATAQMASSTLHGAWGFSGPTWLPSVVLALMSLLLLVLVGVALKHRD